MDAAIIARIAQETTLPESSVAITVSLFEKGATGPFIVHYRKEATGGLDEAKVRSIQERMARYREVYDQRATLLKFMSEQGKLTDELRARIEGCFTKAELDDLHHQFRPRRKTRAAEAIEKGLEPLAEYFWSQEVDAWGVEEHLNVSVDPAKGISTREQALQGVVDIIAEWIWANVDYRKALREILWHEGFVVSTVVPAKVGQKTKYNMYYERKEPVTTIPSHRVLAIRRGCKEGILMSSIEGDASKAIEFLLNSVIKEKESIFAPILEAAVRESYHRILRPLIETEVRTQLKERADREAIRVFQENLANLFLSPPAGPIVVLGVDLGKGDECNVAVVNEAGVFLEGARIRFSQSSKAAKPEIKAPEPEPAPAEQGNSAGQSGEPQLEAAVPSAEPPQEAIAAEPPAVSESAPADALETNAESSAPPANASAPEAAENPPVQESAIVSNAAAVAFAVEAGAPTEEPVAGGNDSSSNAEIEEARKILRDLIAKYNVRAISIGTGTGARELETALRQILSEEGLGDILIAAVNDAGIAIYSSSRIAREEFPDWSASARCAVSLARRLQDPLAELVKIDPKLIGVGQYQHDVDQKELHRGLVQTVQYCVNKVGVSVNAAGEPLLRYVSGLNEKLARRIVAYRTAQGPFRSRPAIKSAVGMDDSTYEQSAAFLRIPDGENALDRTAVHPESYPVVEKMAAGLNVGIPDLIGNRELISSLKFEEFVSESIGMPTLQHIREELFHPGRDPRKSFRVPKFRADVKEMADLKPGMALEGTVTNVTNFGAFVDIGVRQDGLVHLSQMSNRFIRDPREAVKVGDIVQVKVISVEPETKRIGLSMKALLPALQRRRKNRQRWAQKSPALARNPERATAAAGSAVDAASPAAPAERTALPEVRPRPNRQHDGPPRHRKRGARKPEGAVDPEREKEPSPKVPEPSLQEKIAILQSKFRRIN
ncbi:MAG: Tex-like N-terminal domain-containing protein [Acidobacteriota bacterium]